MLRFNIVALIVWSILVVPTVVLWKESILWVSFMSIYAILVSHWTAYIAAKAERANEESD